MCLQAVARSAWQTNGAPEAATWRHKGEVRWDVHKGDGTQPIPHTMGALLCAFFSYFSAFDFEEAVACVRQPQLRLKREMRWERNEKPHFFGIEDPFESSHDLGYALGVDSFAAVRAELLRAHRILSTRASADLQGSSLHHSTTSHPRVPSHPITGWDTNRGDGSVRSSSHGGISNVWRGSSEPRPWADTLAELLTPAPERSLPSAIQF